MTTPSAPPHGARSVSETPLRQGAVGVLHIVLFVIAAAAPLTVVVGATPLLIGAGVGAGGPGVFVIAGAIYLLFAVGYGAVSRYIGNAGAFYTFITHGLGRPLGVGGALLALLAYNAVQIAVYGGFGYFMAEALGSHFSIALPWWTYALACVLGVHFVGARSIVFSGRVLGLLLILEIGVVLLLDLTIMLEPAKGSLDLWSSFTPDNVLRSGFGVSLVFVIASYIGFEATTIFAEEARDRKRTVPRATYCAVLTITAFYVVSAWSIVQAYGADAVVAAANADPANFWLSVSARLLGPLFTSVFNVLVMTSMFACALAFHNSITRYLFSLAREGLVWHRFAEIHGAHHSPYLASRGQTALALVAVTAAALAGLDPYAVMFAWLAALASIALLTVQILAALAIFGFFLRDGRGESVFTRVVAPLGSALALAACLALSVANLPLLTGSDSRIVAAFPWLLLAVVVTGIGLALRLRSRDPAAYGQLGLNVEL